MVGRLIVQGTDIAKIEFAELAGNDRAIQRADGCEFARRDRRSSATTSVINRIVLAAGVRAGPSV